MGSRGKWTSLDGVQGSISLVCSTYGGWCSSSDSPGWLDRLASWRAWPSLSSPTLSPASPPSPCRQCQPMAWWRAAASITWFPGAWDLNSEDPLASCSQSPIRLLSRCKTSCTFSQGKAFLAGTLLAFVKVFLTWSTSLPLTSMASSAISGVNLFFPS